MLGRAAWWWASTLVLVACGGRSTYYGDEPQGAGAESGGGTKSGAGAAGVAVAPSAGSPTMSAGGRTMVEPQPSEGGESSSSSGGSPECPSLPTECWSSDDVVYVGGLELRYPGPGSCGECAPECLECGRSSGCKLPIEVTPHCFGNPSEVKLFVCSTRDGRGACLNTLTSDPYYVDDLGKRWSVVTLEVLEPAHFAQVGSRMASLTLTVTDGVTYRVVPVALLACNTEELYIPPC